MADEGDEDDNDITTSWVTALSTVLLVVGDAVGDYMTADEMAEAKHKADMDDKMKAMIREIIFYALLLFFLLVVINGQQDTDSYRQNSNIKSMFSKHLNKDVSYMA